MPPEAICPLCLSLFPAQPAGPRHCGGCHADGRPLPLEPLDEYLAMVDFDVVESYWLHQSGASTAVQERLLERIGRLRARQASGAVGLSGGILLSG